jgi:hypothetical protein
MLLVVVLVMEIGWWREGGRHVSVVFLFPAPPRAAWGRRMSTGSTWAVSPPCRAAGHFLALPCPALPYLT